MFPSGADIEIVFNPNSIIEGFRKIDRARQEMEKGVGGSVEKFNQAFTSFSEQIVKVSQRAQRAQETYLRSIERQADVYGKSGVEKLIAQRDSIIKRLGTEEEAVKRVTAAYQKMIDVEKKREEERDKHGGGLLGSGTTGLFVRGARDIFEGRMAYGEMDIARGLASLRGAPLIIGGAVAAFAGLTAASYEAAKSMGEAASRIHEIQLVTGMSAREVQQFDYAAKVTGQDIGVVDRMMRGLTQAITDTGSQGIKARETLGKMGIDLLSLQTGATGTMELFKQISTALEEQPNLWSRNKDAIELFKRAGITSLPMLIELNKSLKETQGIQFMSNDQITRLNEVHHQLELLGTEWDQFINQVKASLAKPFILTVKIVREGLFAPSAAPFGPLIGGKERQETIDIMTGYHGAGPVSELLERSRAGIEGRTLEVTRRAMPQMEYRGAQDYLYEQRRSNLEFATQYEGELKKKLNEEIADRTRTGADYAKAVREATKAYEDQHKIVEALRKADADRLSLAQAMARLQEEAAEKAEHPYGMLPAEQEMMRMMKEHPTADRAEVARILRPQLDREVDTILRRAGLRGMPDGSIQRDEMQLKLTGGVTPSGDIGAKEQAALAAAGRLMLDNAKRENEELREKIRLEESILKNNREIVATADRGAARIQEILAPSTVESRLRFAQQELDIARRNAEEEYRDRAAKIADEYGDAESRALAYKNLRLEYSREVYDAEMRYLEEVAQERRRQLDEIKDAVEPLFHTLFTQPSKFGEQLKSTLREATLKPITSGLSEMTAQALHPMIFGATGTGGIAGAMRGMFGGSTGRLNDVKLTSNGAVPVHIVSTSLPTGGTMPTSTGIYSIGGPSGGGGTVGGIPIPSIVTPPTFPSNSVIPLGGFGPLARAAGLAGGGGGGGGWNPFGVPTMSTYWGGGAAALSGGMPTTQELANLPPSTNPWGSLAGTLAMAGLGGAPIGAGAPGRSMMMTNPLQAYMSKAFGWFGGSYFGSGGLSRVGTNIGQYGGAITSQTATTSARLQALSTGPFAGTPIGPAVGGAGTMLAAYGLLGEPRGTVGGVVAGTAGGFLVAGPIGAAVGFGIGVGEMIAGVESPRREAKRLVREIYHIDINNSTADQIVAIAKQNYASHVSLAVRAPEVRQMLGLYAAGTGQADRFPQSATTPHGASLVESGGTLFQQATYQYGNPYTYQSNLPVYGPSGGSLPTPGGNLSLSLNIGGQDAARFMQGNVVTPDVIQTQYAAAMQGSSGRVDQALTLQSPGMIVA